MSNSGGTLTLPSPTHAHHHHVDVQAGFRTLRRSLSRSPSKFSLARNSSQSSSDTGSAPGSPSCRRVQSQLFAQNSPTHAPNAVHVQSPLATPFRPSKFALRSAKVSKSPAASKSGLRNRTSPKSPPVRRALGASLNSVNATPSCAEPGTPGKENSPNTRLRSSPASRSNSNGGGSNSSTPGKVNRHSMHLDMTGASQLTRSRYSSLMNSCRILYLYSGHLNLVQKMDASSMCLRIRHMEGLSTMKYLFLVANFVISAVAASMRWHWHKSFSWLGERFGFSFRVRVYN